MTGRIILAIISFIGMCILTAVTAKAAGDHTVKVGQLIILLLVDLCAMVVCAWIWDNIFKRD